MRVAFVHDYLNQAGGAERALACLHRLFPSAPIYTTIADPKVVDELFPNVTIKTTWMQRLPGITRHHRHYFLLYPLAIEGIDLTGYDLIISTSSAFAKSVRTPPGAVHICWCHTPMRFAWTFDDYAAREQWGALTRSMLRPMMGVLRYWDRKTAHRPTVIVANSATGAERVARHYGRSALVVHPPVSVERFAPTGEEPSGYLIVSRLVGYKRIDLAIDAFNQLGRPLTVIGDGPARADLERRAGPTIEFLGRASDETTAEQYARARALIFPGVEDFGLTPLEANASGRPVIAFHGGGALETVIEGTTGVFFREATAASLARAVERADTIDWNVAALQRHAEQFTESVFHARFLETIRAALPGDLHDDRAVRNGHRERGDVLELLARRG